jgi:hypothetical protein
MELPTPKEFTSEVNTIGENTENSIEPEQGQPEQPDGQA